MSRKVLRMKKTFYYIALHLLLTGTILAFISCASFVGGIKGFYNNESEEFYTTAFNAIKSVMGAFDNCAIPSLESGSVLVNLDTTINGYSIEDKKVDVGNGKYTASVLMTEDLDFDINTNINAFGQHSNVHSVAVGDSFYMDMGGYAQKPFYFKGEQDGGIFKKIKSAVIKTFKEGNYVNGSESYKFHDVSFNANTTEICLNSDVTSAFIGDISDLFIETPNLIYGSYINKILDVSYIVNGEKLHLTWKRYFENNILCRESFKLHDNNGHYIILDTAVLKTDKQTDYVEITLKAFDGKGIFNVLTLAVKTSIGSTDCKTETDVLIGNQIRIEAKNIGNLEYSKGNANVYFMTDLGESVLPISFECKATDGEYKYTLKADSIYLAFDIEATLSVKVTDKTPVINKTDDVYDISVLENRYYYDKAKSFTDKEYNDLKLLLQGKTPEPDEELEEEVTVDPYKLDIYYDYSIKYDTDGSYGKQYVDLLQSDNFTYTYTYHEQKEGYPVSSCTQYKANGKNMYKYNYADGTEYMQLFSGTTRYEVRHDLKKILFTEYSEEDFKTYYPETVYKFYESGLCNYNSKELVFERYYDYSNNKFTFIFDENKMPILMIIEDSATKEEMYTFIEEISDTVPENAMELPSYEYQSVLDHFQ